MKIFNDLVAAMNFVKETNNSHAKWTGTSFVDFDRDRHIEHVFLYESM